MACYGDELRKRLFTCLGTFLGFALILMPFANSVFDWVSKPMLRWLPSDVHLIATQMSSLIWIPMKLILLLSVMFSLPVWLWQCWGFLRPALYPEERQRYLFWAVLASGLFILGIGFAYALLLPAICHICWSMRPAGIQLMPDVLTFYDWCLDITFACALLFEIPLWMSLMTALGLVPHEIWPARRREVMIACLFIAMLLTPPDMISQVMLAAPMIALYECGIYAARHVSSINKTITSHFA